ncbi:hypothetical protein EDB86DRAFT_2888882 [Lactarius hatsudake]|nr:hypothetical protein EDB86DRAFT_2888882 [Lactarius hatsudake]
MRRLRPGFSFLFLASEVDISVSSSPTELVSILIRFDPFFLSTRHTRPATRLRLNNPPCTPLLGGSDQRRSSGRLPYSPESLWHSFPARRLGDLL